MVAERLPAAEPFGSSGGFAESAMSSLCSRERVSGQRVLREDKEDKNRGKGKAGHPEVTPP
jgi:hypothetical protein